LASGNVARIRFGKDGGDLGPPADKMTTPTGQPPAPSNAAPPEQSVARQAIEGFTGKTAVDAGQRTKAKIKAINTQRRQNFEEIPP